MGTESKHRVCPVENARDLDNAFRKWLQNPKKILKDRIISGMTVLDLGCGPGYFTVEIANMLLHSGKVIAADLQEGMLEKVRQKIKGTSLENKIVLHKCDENKIGLTEKVDFILAFYMVHEVPDHARLFEEFKALLKPAGSIFIIEPKFHVTKISFEEMTNQLQILGFEIVTRPKIFFSRSVILTLKK